MTVWILSRGERGEGGSIVAVCATLSKAIEVASAEASRDASRGQDWLERASELSWMCSQDVDWMSIREHTVTA